MKETVQVTRADEELEAWFLRRMSDDAWKGHVARLLARHRLSATSAPAGVEGLRQALEDVCNPLGYLQRMAEAEGNKLGGMAYAIANDISTVQRIARDALAASPAPSGQEVAGVQDGVEHPDDVAVDRFADRMKAKLAAARGKGRGGWDNPERCSTGYLCTLLHEHVAKGDPVDVANFCMMLAHYGASTTPPASGVTVPEGMKAWNGGKSAPEDWNGGAVLLRNGTVIDRGDGAAKWMHATPGSEMSLSDCIAYTPKPAVLSTPSATPGEEGHAERERIVDGAVETIMPSFSWETLEGPENLRARLAMCARGAVWAARDGWVRATATPGALDPATVERCAQVARDYQTVADANYLSVKSRIDGGEEGSEVVLAVALGMSHQARQIVERILALGTDPQPHGGKGA